MNENVKSIIDKCSYTVTDYKLGIDSSVVEFDKEMFVNVIVEEISKVKEQMKEQYLSKRKAEMDFGIKNIYAEGEIACEALVQNIKNHFGIK